MVLRPGNAQQIGSRDEQQDSFAFSHIDDAALVRRAGVLAVVADGMGGLAMGKEASDCTVKTFLSVHEAAQIETPPAIVLQNAVEAANIGVLDLARAAGVEGEAGSTLVAIIVKDSKLYWTSVGDSRIYLYRAGELVRLTTDQNYATELLQFVANGRMTMEEAQTHPERAALTNFIGNPEIKPADSSRHAFPISNGDWIILCSDGLFGTLSDDDIRNELFGNPHDSCERLIKKIVSRNEPYQDNTSVVILACGDNEPVTVRTKKTSLLDLPCGSSENFTPEVPPRKSHLLFILLGMLIGVIISGLILYFWPLHQKSSPEKAIPKKENVQKQPLNPSKTTKSNFTASPDNANVSK